MNTTLKPDVSGLIDITSSIASGYTAPSNGFVSIQTSRNGNTYTLSINGTKVAGAYQYSGDSHGSENKQLFTLIGAGQIVTCTGNTQLAIFVPFS